MRRMESDVAVCDKVQEGGRQVPKGNQYFQKNVSHIASGERSRAVTRAKRGFGRAINAERSFIRRMCAATSCGIERVCKRSSPAAGATGAGNDG